MRYEFNDFNCPHGCGSHSFYFEQCLYDGTHEEEDKEYAWALVPENLRNDIVVYEVDGRVGPTGYRVPPSRWTTRKQRQDNPDIAERVARTRWTPMVCVDDHSWAKCSECQKEVDPEYCLSFVRSVDWSKIKFYEETGMVIINDYSTSRIEIINGQV